MSHGQKVPFLVVIFVSYQIIDSEQVWTQYSNKINFLYISGCTLKFTQGNRMSDGRSTLSDRLEVGCLPPGEKIDISVSMRSPEQPGMYESQWRMATSTGKMCHV